MSRLWCSSRPAGGGGPLGVDGNLGATSPVGLGGGGAALCPPIEHGQDGAAELLLLVRGKGLAAVIAGDLPETIHSPGQRLLVYIGVAGGAAAASRLRQRFLERFGGQAEDHLGDTLAEAAGG